MNGNGALVMRAEKVGSETVLAQIVQLVAQAQRSRAPMQRMADGVSYWFVLAVLAVAIATFLLWGIVRPGAVLDVRRRQRGRGADHRVSVRARARDADVDHGRDRARGAGGRAVSRRRGDRAAAHDRHADRRQDRHADAGQARVPRPCSRSATLSPDEVLRLAASLDQGSEHPLAERSSPRRADRGLALSTGPRSSSRRPASACAAASRDTRWRSATPR